MTPTDTEREQLAGPALTGEPTASGGTSSELPWSRPPRVVGRGPDGRAGMPGRTVGHRAQDDEVLR